MPPRVRVVERGFEYEGKLYRSLSGVAREITGTGWNGPARPRRAGARYRLDRLSRSQADFVRLLEVLAEHEVRFFSVSESFDTSTPHGRFAMGLLMQVAQLEREVTAVRVRDKVIATRRLGIWTGGRPVLGYDTVDKKLVVNDAEAATVRELFLSRQGAHHAPLTAPARGGSP